MRTCLKTIPATTLTPICCPQEVLVLCCRMDPESSSDEDLYEEASGQCLFDLLVDLKLRGVLFATDVCKLSYWAAMSGAKGHVKKLAKEPGDPSPGHYSDHFDRVVGLAAPDPRIYKLDVPVYSKVDGCRMLKPLSFLPPHVVLSNGVSSSPDDFGAKLRISLSISHRPTRTTLWFNLLRRGLRCRLRYIWMGSGIRSRIQFRDFF